jgi:hypothetical protein
MGHAIDPESYSYVLDVLDIEMRGDEQWYLLRERWFRASSGDQVGTRQTWSPRPPKTLHEFLEEIGVRSDCACVECEKEK